MKNKEIAKLITTLDTAKQRLLRWKSKRTDQTRWSTIHATLNAAVAQSMLDEPFLSNNMSEIRLLFDAISRAIITPGVYCKFFLAKSVNPYRRPPKPSDVNSVYDEACPLASPHHQNAGYFAYMKKVLHKQAETNGKVALQPYPPSTIVEDTPHCGLCGQMGSCIAFDDRISTYNRSMVDFYQLFLSSVLERKRFSTEQLKAVALNLIKWSAAYFKYMDEAVAFTSRPLAERQKLISQIASKPNGPGVSPVPKRTAAGS